LDVEISKNFVTITLPIGLKAPYRVFEEFRGLLHGKSSAARDAKSKRWMERSTVWLIAGDKSLW
jgi:hypothetical protein